MLATNFIYLTPSMNFHEMCCNVPLALPFHPDKSKNWIKVVIFPFTNHILFLSLSLSLTRRANDFNVDGALKQLGKTLEWRREMKPDQIKPEDIEKEFKEGLLWISDFDKEGSP